MIITAGKYKGRKVKTLKSADVRPTSSKVRESIFNMVQLSENTTAFYEGPTKFLDLFAGSGIMGLEALSRGAQSAVFAEKNPEAIKVLKENLSIVENQENIVLMPYDALKTLNKFKKCEFNFIFIDPPYKSGLYKPALKLISKKEILINNGIIALEHESGKNFSGLANELGFEVYKTKKYGDTAITIIYRAIK